MPAPPMGVVVRLLLMFERIPLISDVPKLNSLRKPRFNVTVRVTPVVLNEREEIRNAIATLRIAETLRVRERDVLQEVRQREICECSIRVAVEEAVCLNAIVLCAKLECVAADDMRDDILILVRILYASLRQNRIGSKVSGAVTKFDFWLSGVVDERSENRRAPAVG